MEEPHRTAGELFPEWEVLRQPNVPISLKGSSPLSGQWRILCSGVQGIEVEGFNDIGVDVQYPWEDEPRRFHGAPHASEGFLDRQIPSTNGQFKKFMDDYHPHECLCD